MAWVYLHAVAGVDGTRMRPDDHALLALCASTQPRRSELVCACREAASGVSEQSVSPVKCEIELREKELVTHHRLSTVKWIPLSDAGRQVNSLAVNVLQEISLFRSGG